MKIKQMIYQKDRKTELLHKGNYKGYNYYILNLGTHPTAYIEIPKGHKLYQKYYDDIYINVHGGLTYSKDSLMGIKSENWFIGWDYAHYDDYVGFYGDMTEFFEKKVLCTWTTEEITEEFLKNNNLKRWTTEEIIEECKNGIEQIIMYEKGEKHD